ncbi:30S ribosomal protein S12 methylthiotransferase RimO [Candidatus Endoriftia persephone]|jgi:ribosomal protein S12 methylthiotransferase|uniref:Ribosomal protein uS12 methylthiotransferase RimO n=3 Tax=Gammaproteobacteria TaxID=1236 RepID=G2FFP6_9GAMM|nr:30S ribosomal protein S12 methylthiotransferase RimO [Candidatus Endoriftia persephone]EGV50236.1 ribosomal protein S12 methylthiotransferase rimO [endosymbiont of Riftia pachyptila (vent Ph05)]EGW54462.1 ribosomal protein S12 methylthiotransferase RimO [endosymbiont of Tevnia jerichonana (vent Tica)]USF87168.1 30S ribosomal protein S12 methylthiotransferase RimO [Candidatus Endoriftia persephone]
MQKEPQIGFISLGCPKNLVDSEVILSRLRAEGYQISPSYDGADLVVVNTCGFIDAAVEESLDAIGEALRENGRVIVTGCLGGDEARIRAAHPQVLAVTGAHTYDAVLEAIHAELPRPHEPFANLLPSSGVKLTPRHYAYLKISEGCNHRCSFCIIPQLRGDLVSRPLAEVMGEAQRLVEAGVRELLVVSQDTSAYGLDTKYRPDFWQGRPLTTRIHDLAAALGELPAWVRLHYVYPYPHVDDLIPLMAEGHILPYLDMPLQHANQRVLQAMKRPAAKERVLERIQRWRTECPELVLRSTFIVGFPGETEAEFEELLAFLREAQLDRVGCFAYSPVAGATANQLPGALPDEIREQRRARFMEVQSAISAERLAAKIGSEMIVLVDEVNEKQLIARGPGDAPEIDGRVIIPGSWELDPGEFIEVRITGATAHDLKAEPVDFEE